MSRLLVALPALNEAPTLARVIAGVPRALPGVSDVTVLVVDDGSTDATAEEALACGAVVVRHARNLGVGAAFQSARRYALQHGFDLLCCIDADGQFDPRDIAVVAAPVVEGRADFVSGSRFIDPLRVPAMPALKLWGNRQMSALVSRLAGQHFFDVSCGLRALSRDAMARLELRGQLTYTQETFVDLAKKGARILEVPVDVRYFAHRKSRVAGNLFVYARGALSILYAIYRDDRTEGRARPLAALGFALLVARSVLAPRAR